MWIGQPHRSERVGGYSRSSNCGDHFMGTIKVGQFDGVLSVSCTEENLEDPVEWDVAARSRENLVHTRLHKLVHPPRGVRASVVVDGLSLNAQIVGVQT